jgi:ribA/ribD-fused uncharacterized protein
MNVYKKSDVTWFFSKDNPHWALSNMAGGMEIFWPPERQRSTRWNSSEQLYQACKYAGDVECLPVSSPQAEPNVRRRIREAKNARGAKMTQKCAAAAGLIRGDWESPEFVKLKAMLWVLELKAFWNYATFARVLRDTQDRVIVEISQKDTFWGCRDDGHGNLTGENHLGLLLMQTRARLPEITRRQFTHPEGFLLP